jgi:hypothetical protein
METLRTYGNYPLRIVILSNFVSLAIYGFGLFIIFRLGLAFSFLYLLYILIFEYRLIRNHCTNCFYWGKICGFGKGKLSSWFFKKGDVTKFCMKDMTWKELIPDILIAFIPFVLGSILLIVKFDVLLLSALVLLALVTTFGNGFIRGTLTCRYCQQRELGCPAYVLFHKEK